jgi:hypothetical protein
MRIVVLTPLLVLCLFAKAQPLQPIPSLPEMARERLKVKFSLFDFSMFSLPAVKLHGEYLIGNREKPLSAGIDLGYIYYSVDEDTKASGTFTGLRLNSYRRSTIRSAFATSISVFRSKTYLNDYLKLEGKLPDMSGGNYFYYERMKYHKLRYGFSAEVLWQHKLAGRFFIEVGTGIGYVQFKTNVPDRVVQHTFVNGLTERKLYEGPTLLFSTKIGFSIF